MPSPDVYTLSLHDALPILTADPSWRVRLQAAVVLGKLRDGRAVPSLLRALGDENETVRGLSAQVLGDLGDSAAIAALEQVHKRDRKSTRLNSSHTVISYAVSRCLHSFPTRRSSDLDG